MPRHNPYDISYTQANDPVDCAAKNMEMPEKDPLEYMQYDKYVFNYAQLVQGSSNLVGLSSFTCEAGESDLLAPYAGWCNGIKISYMLGNALSRQRFDNGTGTFYTDFGAQFNPRVSLIARRDIAFGAESGWVSGIQGCRYGVNEPAIKPITLAESSDFLTHISGEFASGRATHMFYSLGANLLYNNHKGVDDCDTGHTIYSGILNEALTEALAQLVLNDHTKLVVNAAKSAGAKGIVLGGIYNRFLFPTGWSMGFQDQTSLDRVEVFVDTYNNGLKEYAEEIGAVYVDYREFQKDMQGEYNQKPYVKFPAPYQHIKVHNQSYDSVENRIVGGELVPQASNRAAMFSDRGTFYYNFGQAHMNNIMLHALNKCYGTSIKLIDPTEMVLLCGLQTDFNSYSSRVQGGGSGIAPEDNNGGTIVGANSNRPDFGVDSLGSNTYTKTVTSVDFPEQVDRGRQSSVRFGGTNRPKKQDYGDRTG